MKPNSLSGKARYLPAGLGRGLHSEEHVQSTGMRQLGLLRKPKTFSAIKALKGMEHLGRTKDMRWASGVRSESPSGLSKEKELYLEVTGSL